MFGIYLISRDQYPFYIIKDLQKDFYVFEFIFMSI